jgi:hypothetical protein
LTDRNRKIRLSIKIESKRALRRLAGSMIILDGSINQPKRVANLFLDAFNLEEVFRFKESIALIPILLQTKQVNHPFHVWLEGKLMLPGKKDAAHFRFNDATIQYRIIN